MTPNSQPEKGNFYRADHFEFSKAGSAVSLHRRRQRSYRQAGGFRPAKERRLHRQDYHQASDEVNPEWDLSGAVQDIQLLFEVGYQVANGKKFPEWKPGRVQSKTGRDTEEIIELEQEKFSLTSFLIAATCLADPPSEERLSAIGSRAITSSLVFTKEHTFTMKSPTLPRGAAGKSIVSQSKD